MKVWRRPRTEVQKFEANEYVAACGNGTTYLFTCDAGGGKSGKVYVESNGVEGLQTTGEWVGGLGGHWQAADESLGGYHACQTTHQADSEDNFLNGYYVPYGSSSNALDVIIWRGEDNDNVHCTTKLNQEDWEIARS